MVQTAYHLMIPIQKADLSFYDDFPDAQIQKAARHDWGWLATGKILNLDGHSPGVLDFSRHVAYGEAVRAYNPRHRIGWYVGGIASSMQYDPPFHALTDADLLHAPNGAPLRGPIPSAGPGSPGDDSKLANLGSARVQDKLIALYLDQLAANGWDGILIDSVSPVGYADWVASANRFNCPTGCLEGPAHTMLWWRDAMSRYLERMRWAFENRGYQVYCNGLAPGPLDPNAGWTGTGLSDLAEVCSGLLYEFPNATMGNPHYMRQAIEAAHAVTAKRRELLWLVTPQVSLPAPNLADDQLLLRQFHLAQFLLIHEPPYTSYGYWPYEPYSAWRGLLPDGTLDRWIHWEDAWEDVDALGPPLAACQPTSGLDGGQWARAYSHGAVYANCTNVNMVDTIAVPMRKWDRTAGDLIPAGVPFTIPPYQGWALYEA